MFYTFASIGYSPLILDLFFLLSVVSAMLIIVNKNPVISVLFLICLFFSVACYLISVGLEFLGLSYLLVYVGAVSILFLFILMLINVRISELLSDTSKTVPFAVVAAVSFAIISERSLPFSFFNKYTLLVNNQINDSVQFVTSSSWDKVLTDTSHISSLGNIMYTSYSMWLLITCVILLLAMVGTILITIKSNSK